MNQGAEAVVRRVFFNDKESVEKERVSKKYRHPDLDEKLTKKRSLQEARCLQKAFKASVNVPTVYKVTGRSIIMEYIDGCLVKDAPDSKQMYKNIGIEIGKLHEANIIHGDLTTSNLIAVGDKVFIFDFGLSFISNSIEDKAVDLYVLEKAIESLNQNSDHLFELILGGYSVGKDSERILKQLERVRMRGRKREMIG